MLLCDLGGVGLFLVERLAPPHHVAVPALDVAEGRLVDVWTVLPSRSSKVIVTSVSTPADGPSFSQVKVKTRRLSGSISR
jgi:hypothetical protein